MFDRLDDILIRYQQIMEELNDPDVVNDQKHFRKLMKEQSDLQPLVEKYTEYKNTKQTIEDSLEMLEVEDDEEMKEMLKEELSEAKSNIAKIEQELKVLLIPKDPMDEKNVIVEIRAGAGGDEAALFAAELFRMYSKYAESKRWKIEMMDVSENGIGGFKECVFMVSGDHVYSRMKFESGVHRVQRVPETESGGRVHTSTATVAVLPEMEEVDVQINPADIEMQVYRASGAGGQHVNKTSSAVRLTHIPTGIVVSCQIERSQHQNREVAMRMLKSKLVEIKERENLERIEDIKGDQKEIAWGSQIRSYVFMPYTLAKDHRTGFEMGNITAVMDGDIDSFINAYLKKIANG